MAYYKGKTALQCFTEKYTANEDGCWIWEAATIGNGYGRFRDMLAHRWAYEHFVGIIPYGLEIDHLCRVRNCVNPKHLELVTHAENGRRGIAGDHRIEEAKLITHCPSGHEYNADNTHIADSKNGSTHRVCRACKREKRRVYYKENAAEINYQKRLRRIK